MTRKVSRVMMFRARVTAGDYRIAITGPWVQQKKKEYGMRPAQYVCHKRANTRYTYFHILIGLCGGLSHSFSLSSLYHK